MSPETREDLDGIREAVRLVLQQAALSATRLGHGGEAKRYARLAAGLDQRDAS